MSIVPYLGTAEEVPGREPLLGEPAPDFQLPDEEGTLVTLRRLTRLRPLLLYLYRGAW